MLPPAGSEWPAAERTAWLGMMNTAFTLAYGAAEEMPMAPVARPAAAKRSRPAPARSAPRRPRAEAKPRPPGPEFFIDKEHYARRAGGDRINHGEVLGLLVDLRGESGDLGKITWADGTVGISRGVQLDITTTAA